MHTSTRAQYDRRNIVISMYVYNIYYTSYVRFDNIDLEVYGHFSTMYNIILLLLLNYLRLHYYNIRTPLAVCRVFKNPTEI